MNEGSRKNLGYDSHCNAVLLFVLFTMALLVSGCQKGENTSHAEVISPELIEQEADDDTVNGHEEVPLAMDEGVAEEKNLSEEEIITEVEISGTVFDIDCQEITVRKISLSDRKSLTHFTQLTLVDAREAVLSLDDMRTLALSFPGIEFLFTIPLKGIGIEETTVDGTIEEWDISNQIVVNVELLKKVISLLPRLKQLMMCDCGLSNEVMNSIRNQFPDVKVVWMLHMAYYSLRTDAVAFSTMAGDNETQFVYSADCEQFKYCTDLKALDLGHQYIRDISFLEYLPELRVLILADNGLSDITPIGTLTELRYLELFHNTKIESWEPLRNCTKLTDLNICFCTKPKDLTFLEDLPNLERLWCVGCITSMQQREYVKSVIPEDCEMVDWGEDSTSSGWRENEKQAAQYNGFLGNYLDPMFE